MEYASNYICDEARAVIQRWQATNLGGSEQKVDNSLAVASEALAVALERCEIDPSIPPKRFWRTLWRSFVRKLMTLSERRIRRKAASLMNS